MCNYHINNDQTSISEHLHQVLLWMTKKWIFQRWWNFGISISSLTDGTLTVIYILACLEEAERPKILIVCKLWSNGISDWIRKFGNSIDHCFLAAKYVPQLLLQKQKAVQDFHEKKMLFFPIIKLWKHYTHI